MHQLAATPGPRVAIVLVLASALACGSPEEPGFRGGPSADSGATLRIAVSEFTYPLMVAIERAESVPGLELVFLPPTHSRGVIAATETGESDIGVISRMLNSEERERELRYLPLASDILVFATHRGVGIDGLTTDQVLGIYSGEITNWKEVGGGDSRIVVLDRSEHASAKRLVRDQVFGEDLEITSDAVVLERPRAMNTSLATIEDSIGFTTLGQIVHAELDVRVLELDGVSPTPTNLAEGRYRLALPFGLVIRREPARKVMGFVAAASRDPATQSMRSGGFLPTALNLVFATIPETAVISQEQRYRPLIDYLSEKLGPRHEITLRHLSSYEELVAEFMKGSVNAAFFGSYTYALVRNRIDVDPIARPELDGVSQYRGLILVRRDAGIDSWSDLRGKSFSMIEKTTAGELFPRLYLKRRGVERMDRFFRTVVRAGSHDASILKVLEGEVDAGAAKNLVYERLAREDPRIESELVILAESPAVPENALVVRDSVALTCFACHQATGQTVSSRVGSSGDLRATLRDELLNLKNTPEGRRVLDKYGADRFVGTTHSDYETLYRMIRELGLPLAGS